MNKKLQWIPLILIILVLIIGAAAGVKSKPANKLPPSKELSAEEQQKNEPVKEVNAPDELLAAVAQQLSNKYQNPVDSYQLTAQMVTDRFAKGTLQVRDQAGGGLWFAAKTDKGWELADDGNGIIKCEIANKYDFPKDMIPGCIEGDQVINR